MKKYIEQEAALKTFEPQCGDWSECWSAEEIKPKLESIPAADVVKVRHGRWERVDYGNGLYNYHCSSCRHIPRENIRSNYCPNCGAKMTEV